MNSEFFHEVVKMYVEKERTISYFSRMMKIKLRETRTSLLTPLNTIKTYLGQHLETNEVVNSQDNEDLCKSFTKVEVKDVLLEMETNKAAGPNAIPIEFY
jgi:hypothetical protein